MITRMVIRDFILVKTAELSFRSGLLVITGETGAGKSLVVEALSILLGDRADSRLIREGAQQADLSAEFSIHTPVLKWLEEHDFLNQEDKQYLLIRRVIDTQGRSRAYLNGIPCLLQQLRQVGSLLVDICGQHAHQSLLSISAQQTLFDRCIGLSELASTTQDAWKNYRHASGCLKKATKLQEQHLQQREQLLWFIDELSELELTKEQWISLNDEHSQLSHHQTLQEGIDAILNCLETEKGVCDTLNSLSRQIEQLSSLDKRLLDSAQLLHSAFIAVQESLPALRHYLDGFQSEPGRLHYLNDMLDKILRIARKHHLKPEEIPLALSKAKETLQALEANTDLTALIAEMKKKRDIWHQMANTLNQKRHEHAPSWSKQVQHYLCKLGMEAARFEVGFHPSPENEYLEQASFLWAANPGTSLRALAKVASGGELSRITLALQVMASSASTPTLVFDEVDVGIAGNTAAVVGELLRHLGNKHQVICITHQAQVAAAGHWHWRVKKQSSEWDTVSETVELTANQRVEEIARILCGQSTPEKTAREHAQALLNSATAPAHSETMCNTATI